MSNDPELNYEITTEEFSEYDLIFKVIILGDSGVGKSCLTLKATKDRFEPKYAPTIGFDFLTFGIKINNKNINLQIWDTCGQEVYRSLIGSFYRNSSLAILVFSVDNEKSFNNLEMWLNEVKSQSSVDMNIILIGNKNDLENERKIDSEKEKEFCEENNISIFFETSAKTGFNAKKVFVEAAKLLYEQHLKNKNRASRPDSMGKITIGNDGEIIDDYYLNYNKDEENRKKKCYC